MLFDLLRTVRSRRVGYGYRVDSGERERHPVTGRILEQVAGPRRFVSAKAPLRLSDVEEALLAWAGLGPNGLITWEASLGAGFDQLTSFVGRTAPEPNNTRATDLILINDDGATLYRPEVRATSVQPLADDVDAFIDLLVTWHARDRLPLADERPAVDWAMRDPDYPRALLHGSHQYNLNRPGSTWFLPVTDAGRLQSGLVDLFARRRHYIVDDIVGEVAGLDGFVAAGQLERPLRLSDHERSVLVNSAYPAGAIVQNVRLAAEAMGLGSWCLSGYDAEIVLGLRPDLTRGLSFSAHGRPGVKECTCLPSPRFANGDEVVEDWRREQEATLAAMAAAASEDATPFAAEVAAALATAEEARPPEWAREAAAAYIDYCVAAHGRWPVTYEPLLASFSVVVHHVDTDYYDRHHRPGHITDRIRRHDSAWHGVAPARAPTL